jgi:hypothetical protein
MFRSTTTSHTALDVPTALPPPPAPVVVVVVVADILPFDSLLLPFP